VRLPNESVDALIIRFNRRIEVRTITSESRRRLRFESERDKELRKAINQGRRRAQRRKRQERYLSH